METQVAHDYRDALALSLEAAREAGALLRAELRRAGGPGGAGQVADIDVEVERALRARLLARFPWHWLGEETGASDATGDDVTHRWVVDPNDGTAAFLRGARGSAVSIAALRGSTPVLGVVFAFAYPDDDGDLIAWAEGCGPITRNGVPVHASLVDGALTVGAPVIVSQHADRAAEAHARAVAPGRYRPLPSIAYRLALVAVGEAAACMSLAGPVSWDFAAGHALVRAAGGELVDAEGVPVTYDARGESSPAVCFGGAPAAIEALRANPWNAPGEATARGRFRRAHLERGEAARDAGQLCRAQGCLLGQFVGDALGGLVEFRGASAIAARYPDGVRDLADGGTWGTLAGQPTDDSELALMLARALVEDGDYLPEAVCAAYVHWIQSGPFDRGGTITKALSAGVGVSDRATALRRVRASASLESQANGSLMRIAPLGVFFAGRPDLAGRFARVDSALTHPHPLCQDACAVFTSVIARAIDEALTPAQCFDHACDVATEPALRAVLDASRDAPPDDYDTNQGWVRIAAHNAFYQLTHAESLEAGLIATVSAGGDTDTNGAIAGALLGAVHGRAAFPMRWITPVLSCRALREAGARRPRPPEFWPADVYEFAERLLVVGARADGTLPRG